MDVGAGKRSRVAGRCHGIREHARSTITGLTNPELELLKMRRLVITEAERFPEIGREFYERSWVRVRPGRERRGRIGEGARAHRKLKLGSPA